ncbi:MAG: hypothetical protein Q7S40_33880 [Opitutaceae bacterium]|nr:hypothetical protein [Opitutaceae bacterium]
MQKARQIRQKEHADSRSRLRRAHITNGPRRSRRKAERQGKGWCSIRGRGRDAAKKSADSGPRADDDTAKVKPERVADRVVVFKSTPEAELKLHFYFPPGWSATDRRPAMIFWFGGGFNQGSPAQFFWQAEYFSAGGSAGATLALLAAREDGPRCGRGRQEHLDPPGGDGVV